MLQRIVRTSAAVVAVASAGAAFVAPPAVAARPGPPVAPSLTVLDHTGRTARGYLFTGPKIEGTRPVGAPVGPLISDGQGRPVWFRNLPTGVSATDVRVQRYRGRPVLTYWQGTSIAGAGHGAGVDRILDQHYRTVATVRAGRGEDADQHEFWLTRRNTALITVYRQTTVDASSVGGPTNQSVLEGVVQEIDVRTGRVLLDWHSLAHVPLRDSHQPLPASASTPWDYFHVNAVRPDADGNLLVSARHTWTVYKIARRTGRVIWQLGGRHSSFTLGRGVRFAWQHDPKPAGHDDYRIFDNESNGTAVRPRSRVITVHVDTRARRATLVRSIVHPQGLLAPSQGDSQLLPNGDTLVGWGALGRVSEFNARGRLIFDATVPAGYDTYRAYRSGWVGRPLTRPRVAVGGSTVHVVWNGATQVRTWQLLGGSSRGALTPYRATPWNGLDTSITATAIPAYVQAVALDARGRVLARSAVTAT